MPYSKASFDKMRAKKRKDKIEDLKDRAMAAYDLYARLKAHLYELDELEGDKLHMWCEDQPL
jgi:hypothetical protein